MEIKVLDYSPEPWKDFQLGVCTVDVGGKVQLLLKVFRNKKGHMFCGFNTLKTRGEWECSFSFIDKEYEKKFLNECREQLKPLLAQVGEPISS